MNAATLEQQIRRGIPISRQMDFRVLELEPAHILVRGGGEENVNVHGTAFAGSLYAVCTLAVWGLSYSRLPPGSDLVMANGAIRYRRPVRGEILARCDIAPDTMTTFLEQVAGTGRGRLDAQARVRTDEGDAALFEAQVHASRKVV